MRKKHLGILIFLLGIFLVGCSDIKSQDISAFQGISIAHRGISRITPISDQYPTEELVLKEDQEQASISPTLIGYISTESEISSPEVVKNPTETPINEDIRSTPTPTPPQKNILENTPESDQVSLCKPEFNQNFETKVIQLINAERNKEGLPFLSEHALLTQAARQHSADMACNQFFSHLSPTNGDVEQRMALQNYTFSAIGENIAAGYISPEDVVQGWMNSTGHRANIMSAAFTQIGVGYVYLEGSDLEIYWTLIVGTP
jgi:uncharacterized protein YkwD